VISELILFIVWKASELQQALNPIVNKLWALDPEALPFRSPVDPEALGIPVSIIMSDIIFKYLTYMHMSGCRAVHSLFYVLLLLLLLLLVLLLLLFLLQIANREVKLLKYGEVKLKLNQITLC